MGAAVSAIDSMLQARGCRLEVAGAMMGQCSRFLQHGKRKEDCARASWARRAALDRMKLPSLTRDSGILSRCRHRHATHGSRALRSHARGGGCAGQRGRVLRPAAICTLPCGLASAYLTLSLSVHTAVTPNAPSPAFLASALQPPTAWQRAHASLAMYLLSVANWMHALPACTKFLGLKL
jgi:hypothetical protein